MGAPSMASDSSVLSVSALTAVIKEELEMNFADLWVEGELTGVKYHTSGHCYFSLKDAGAQISCNLWRATLARVRFRLRDGEKVLIRGALSVYEPRGTYSLVVNRIEPRGIGELQLAFEQLKRKLEAEGLFDARRKRPLPFFANRIGVVTSPTAAAFHDLLNVIFRRNPFVEVVLSPARVQGDGAAREIAAAIARLNRFKQVDVIIVGRGGGAYEDLFCFNEEVVARAIAASELPVVSAVGHEVDVTIADFVADLRAPTPSAAAELVVKDRLELLELISQRTSRLERAFRTLLMHRQQRLMGLSERVRDPRRKLAEQRRQLTALHERLDLAMQRSVQRRALVLQTLSRTLEQRTPHARVLRTRRELTQLQGRIERAMARQLQLRKATFGQLAAQLEALSPLAVLSRGYAIAQLGADGPVLRRAADALRGDTVILRLHEGRLRCVVEGEERA